MSSFITVDRDIFCLRLLKITHML